MIIILEGPDGQGKTTLAAALMGFLESREVEVEYHKSPAGQSTDWDVTWGVWVKIFEKVYHDTKGQRFVILDRVPEISEPIYAFANNRKSRYEYPVRGWAEWNTAVVFPIFCMAHSDLHKKHRDPWGTKIGKEAHSTITALYDYTAWLFQFFMPHTFMYDYIHCEAQFYAIQRELGAKNPWFPPATSTFDFEELVERGKEKVQW